MDSDRQTIDFYFDFLSPFGWIAAERIVPLAAHYDCSINWRPILLKATVVGAMGLKPLLDTPLKGDYLLHDAKRQARLYGLSLSEEASSVFSSVAAARAVIWARNNAPEAASELVLALYRRQMSFGEDISSAANIVAIAASAGIDADDLAAGLEDPAVKAELKSDVDAAIARGIFGSPTLVVEDEIFWGSDRVDQAMAWLVRGGW